MNQENPKIDIETLRIEVREYDLDPYPRSYLSYICTLRDNKRVFTHGDFSDCQDSLNSLFGFRLPYSFTYFGITGDYYLKQHLLDFYESPQQQMDTIHRGGWKLANLE